MMSFEDWKDKELVRGEYKTWVEWRGEAYETGAASRQAEIDALKAKIDEALNVFKSDLSEIGKFDTIHKILKGELK